jgi:hypothetical protein
VRDKICPRANIVLPPIYEHDEKSSATEAEVVLDNWRENVFSLHIFPSLFKLADERKIDFVLMHELTHVKDVINPDFHYDGTLRPSNSLDTYVNLEATIWDISIDVRLENDGHDKIITYEDRFLEYQQKHWPQYNDIVTLDINKVKEIVENLNCARIKMLAKGMVDSWQERISNMPIRL